MLKKTFRYENFGVHHVEEYYFEMSKADILRMINAAPGGDISKHLEHLVEEADGEKLMATFEDLISKTVGKRIEDRFIKSPEIRTKFMGSEAYNMLFVDMCTKPGTAADFINAVFPAEHILELQKLSESLPTPDEKKPAVETGSDTEVLGISPGSEIVDDPSATVTEDSRPAWEREMREPSNRELQLMGPDEMRRAFAMRGELKATES